jgi:hypothetical protein
MNRRQFVSTLAGGAGAVAFGATPDPEIRQVLAMFKCHFDAGFIDTQKNVVDKYIDVYFPQAIRLVQSQRESGGDPYVWTTGSWLVYECLERTSGAARKNMEEALGRGDIAWHALPFTWQSEFLDVPTVEGCIGFSKSLDRRFGRTTTGGKMTDVPGHTRGLVSPLAQQGVKFLDIGVNAASTAPEVPDLFTWEDPEGHQLTVMYHRFDYGGVVIVPGSPVAVSVNVRNDNSGPHTPEEIRAIFADLRRRFPNASIKAANLTEIANAVEPYASKLPAVTSEIGDTWIYGVPSDPVKVARFRETLRLRRKWIADGRWTVGGDADLAFLRRFALGGEHTWGADTKTWLDFDHYTPSALASVIDTPKYQVMVNSWAEKRDDIQAGIDALPQSMREETMRSLQNLRPERPAGQKSAQSLNGIHYEVALDPATGALVRLKDQRTGFDWASSDHPLALFTYQTLSKADYDRFLAQYITVQNEWAPKDFGKPNIQSFGAESKVWRPTLIYSFAEDNRLMAKLKIQDCPEEIWLEFVLQKEEPAVQVNLSWFGKPKNRMPEALWLSFKPQTAANGSWSMTKLGQSVSVSEVVPGGNRHMHALSDSISYTEGEKRFSIETLDAPVVSLGVQSPIYFSNDQPNVADGLHFSLFNNGWGTNYIQWFGEDMRFRFVIRT